MGFLRATEPVFIVFRYNGVYLSLMTLYNSYMKTYNYIYTKLFLVYYAF